MYKKVKFFYKCVERVHFLVGKKVVHLIILFVLRKLGHAFFLNIFLRGKLYFVFFTWSNMWDELTISLCHVGHDTYLEQYSAYLDSLR
jgi:hypothetical protein